MRERVGGAVPVVEGEEEEEEECVFCVLVGAMLCDGVVWFFSACWLGGGVTWCGVGVDW